MLAKLIAMPALLLLPGALLLVGCESVHEMHHKECVRWGLKRGTPAYANCRAALESGKPIPPYPNAR